MILGAYYEADKLRICQISKDSHFVTMALDILRLRMSSCRIGGRTYLFLSELIRLLLQLFPKDYCGHDRDFLKLHSAALLLSSYRYLFEYLWRRIRGVMCGSLTGLIGLIKCLGAWLHGRGASRLP